MPENNYTLTETVNYIKHHTGASNRRARAAALRCFHDPVWCFQMYGIDLYHRIHHDPTGETATTAVLTERGY